MAAVDHGRSSRKAARSRDDRPPACHARRSGASTDGFTTRPARRSLSFRERGDFVMSKKTIAIVLGMAVIIVAGLVVFGVI
jgi:hypothetical protein